MTKIDFNLPPIPRAQAELGIGIVGSGGILRNGHLPAYRKAGFRVAAIAARNAETRGVLAAEFKIPNQFGDWREMVDRDDIHVLDIAIPGEGRLEIVKAAASAGKHILMQKPIANTLDEAREMVSIADSGRILLAVNQQARWAHAYRAAKSVMEQGLIGEPFDILHVMRNSQGNQEWFHHGWHMREARFQIVQYMVHYIDIVRMWTSESAPVAITARISRRPGQKVPGELAADVLLDYPRGVRALISDRNDGWVGSPVTVDFEIGGTEGTIYGNVLTGDLTVRSARLSEPVTASFGPGWFPDAFAYTMGDLLDAIATGREPECSGERNLGTMEIVEAVYRSAESGMSARLPPSPPRPSATPP